jgi:hypothetical protein
MAAECAEAWAKEALLDLAADFRRDAEESTSTLPGE